MTQSDIFSKLNIKSPYPYISSLNIQQNNGPDWGGNSPVFADLINKYQPRLILELGAFLGNSTITMAKQIKQMNLDCTIITVDTWLGSQEHWIKEKCNLLHLYNNFEYGISAMYNQFIANILHEQIENYIVPIPSTTDTAYDVLSYNGFKFDMIYMDADHRHDVVYNDIVKYQNLLTENGVMFGHDIDWDDVHSAVSKYCKKSNKTFNIINDDNDLPKFWQL